jgi:cell wall-associated NlpC family hydrolase
MKRLMGVVVAATLFLMAAPLLAGAVLVVALVNDAPTSSAPSPWSGPLGRIPPAMLAAYRQGATACPGLSWTVLAAIGSIESDNGQSRLPGVSSGHNSAGAAGPMQFEPSTFARYSRPIPPGGADPPTPYDPLDAAFAAARLLCFNGAANAEHLPGALFAYNHSAAYVSAVLQLAAELAALGPTAVAQVAVQFALGQIGTPYRWGSETPGVAFDCSGLVQAAWAAAGVSLPRVAQEQFDLGPRLPKASTPDPGDLVFFGRPGGGVTHVGMVVDGSGLMVDAPHSGAVVRVESFPRTAGAPWGNEIYLGATRPEGFASPA